MQVEAWSCALRYFVGLGVCAIDSSAIQLVDGPSPSATVPSAAAEHGAGRGIGRLGSSRVVLHQCYGRRVLWTVDAMRPLVAAFDERVRRDMSRFDRLREPAHARGSVLREPASEEDIAGAEARLGVGLPPSYRSFLLISNGAYASALGAEVQYPAFLRDWRHGLLRVADIDRTVNADPVGVEVWCETIPELNDP